MSSRIYPDGLLGRKLGMTQVFTPDGEAVGVTVIQLGPCTVLDVRRRETHGYDAVQFGFVPKKAQRVTRAELGHFARAGKGAFAHVKEVRCDLSAREWNLGVEVTATDLFTEGDFVDVSGQTIGKGFSGVVRRFKVKGQPMTRGTHEYRRHIGAIGCRKFPGRVFKNQRMPGRQGNDQVTIQNLKIVAMRPEDNVILVRGGIPGGEGALVVVRKAMKSGSVKAA